MQFALLLLVASIAGCATGPTRSEVLAALVGHPEADALRTLGAPNRILEANGSRFLAYDERRLDYAPAPGFGPYGYGYFFRRQSPISVRAKPRSKFLAGLCGLGTCAVTAAERRNSIACKT